MTFTGAVPDGGPDTSVYFRFERLPYPDTEPSFNLDPVVVSGEAEQQYTVTVPAQDAANTYESFLLYVVDQDQPVIVKDIAVNHDGGSSDDEITEPEYVAPTSSGISILTDGQIDALWGGDSSLGFRLVVIPAHLLKPHWLLMVNAAMCCRSLTLQMPLMRRCHYVAFRC